MPQATAPVRKFATDFDGAESTPVRHDLGTRDVVVAVYERAALHRQVAAEVRVVDENTVRLEMSAVTRGIPYRAVVIG